MFLSDSIVQPERFQVVESIQKFEDLLVTNNLFVDYFNAFLLNPGLSEKLKFNFVSGDLELIEDSNENISNKSVFNGKRELSANEQAAYGQAVVVKKKLENQLKSIIKTHSGFNNNINSSRLNSRLNNQPSRISFKDIDLHNIKSARKEKEELLKHQVENHSFKDIDLIEIQSCIDQIEFKSKNESEIPVLNNTYKVNVLKKPFSMKWLFLRRLSLFLQSELYNEFKLGMLLLQCQILNSESTKSGNVVIKFVKIEIDKELIDMNFNPFEAKNDYERLQNFYIEDENKPVEIKPNPIIQNIKNNNDIKKNEEDTKIQKVESKNEEKKIKSIIKKQTTVDKLEEKKTLIKAGVDMYDSLKHEKSRTSLLTIKSNEIKPQDLVTDETITKKVLDDLARQLVNTVLNKSLEIIKKKSIDNEPKIINRELNTSQLSTNKTASRLGYYKDFQTDKDLKLSFETDDYDSADEVDGISEKIVFEFEDEPYEITNPTDDFSFRRTEIESFKVFLKENDAFLYYKLWLDIEKLNTISNQIEKIAHLRQLKFEYNRPQIFNRLNREAFSNSVEKKNKYEQLYEQYEKNIDFWSLEYLTKTLQQKVLNLLLNYWWPKYQIKMTDFNNYMSQKYETYSNQKKVMDSQKVPTNDYEAQNIEKSVKNAKNFKNKETDKNSDSSQSNKQDQNENKVNKKLNKKIVSEETKPVKKSIKESAKLTENFSAKKAPTGLEGYDLDEFLTSPPVGWKRPASTATVMIKSMINNKQNKKSSTDEETKRKRLDKEIYLEAIYHDDVAGQIFKKYLISRNKSFAVNRLKCLQDLMKYKELFYDENFNQESAKNDAFEIYRKYISVSAMISIDCSKSDRLHLHTLFADPKLTGNLNNTAASFNRPPVYEDTFNFVEEFLINILYDDWKVFIETEKSFFNHNEIENIERTVNVRSKQIDDLLNKGLIRMDSALSGKTTSRRGSGSSAGNSFIYSKDQKNNQQFLTLKEIINNSREFEMFKAFLQSKNALIDVLFWQDLEAYSQLDPLEDEQIEIHAKMLKAKYLNKKYFFNKNGPIDEETQNIILEKIGGWNKVLEEKPSNQLLKLAKKHIETKIKSVWIPTYHSSEYKSKSRFNERTLMHDVVDDVLFLKNGPKINKATATKKNRWLYSSSTVINFGKSLKNSFTTKLFSKFLTYKMYSNGMESRFTDWESDNNNNKLVNNLQFLVDVQEYKDLCQKNSDDERAIIFKMNHIIDCYVNNRILPKIRIDITKELADEILYQKDYLSPYLFLEANLIIFNYLMPFWLEFNQMRHDSDIDILDEFRSFKKLKDFKPNKRSTSAESSKVDESLNLLTDQSIKWRYTQYVKALNTQLLL